MPTIIKVTPITKRIMSIIRPKQPSASAYFATAKKQTPIITNATPTGTPKITEQAARKIIVNISLIYRYTYLSL